MPDESKRPPDAQPAEDGMTPTAPPIASHQQQPERWPAWYFALSDALTAARAPLITAILYFLCVALPDQSAEAARIMLGWSWYLALPGVLLWFSLSLYLAVSLASLAKRALGINGDGAAPLAQKLLVLALFSVPFLAGFLALQPLETIAGWRQVTAMFEAPSLRPWSGGFAGGAAQLQPRRWILIFALSLFGAFSLAIIIPLLRAWLAALWDLVRAKRRTGPVPAPAKAREESLFDIAWLASGSRAEPLTFVAAGLFLLWLAVMGVLEYGWGMHAEIPTLLFLPLWAMVICAGLILMVRLSEKRHVPVLMPGLLIVLLWSCADVSDNHEIRHARLPAGTAAAPMPLEDAFRDWLKAREPEVALWAAAGRRFPALLVAAEGGGARAAYFTALVLEELRARCPRLLRHTFLMAGVSGGSVGAALVAASAHAAALPPLPGEPEPEPLGCEVASIGGPRTIAFGANAEATLALDADLLSPLVRGTLIPDLAARLFPADLMRPLPEGVLRRAWDDWIRRPFTDLTDRSRFLERALDRAWRGQTGRSLESLSFRSVWHGPWGEVPALMLLATDVATGRRLAVSHLAMPGAAATAASGNCAPPLAADASPVEIARMRSLGEEVPGVDLPLSTAALLSARFTLLSPAGTLPCPGPRRRLVDGGYFENSGLTTMLDVVDGLRDLAGERGIALVILRIENSRATTNADTVAGAEQPNPSGALAELASPVRTLLATREARGEQARAAVGRAVTQSRLTCATTSPCVAIEEVVFALAPGCVPIPLGWSLSDGARQEMQEQLLGLPPSSGELCAQLGAPGRAQNRLAMDRVFRLLERP
jgi:hypothetical protein